jgi:Flp pilus assembly protein TadB
LPPAVARGRLSLPQVRIARLTTVLMLLLVAAVATGLALQLRQQSSRRRAMTQVLDAADALEERLRTARVEIEAIVGSDQNPVRDAMHEMLRQRLWLQQHGVDASLEQLITVRDSIDAARERIEQQLLQIERARTLLY